MFMTYTATWETDYMSRYQWILPLRTNSIWMFRNTSSEVVRRSKSSGIFRCFAFHALLNLVTTSWHWCSLWGKRRRIDGSASRSVGEGLIELEVLSMSGECMLTLNVSDSMLGRDLWTTILDKLPFKPGHQLVLSHNTSKLVLHESLERQGFRSEREQVSATYMPVNLLDAMCYLHRCYVEDEEFSLNGITEMTGRHTLWRDNLPKSLHTLTFAPGFNQGLCHARFPKGLQCLTFGWKFNQSLDNVTWPAGLQSITFGEDFNQSMDIFYHILLCPGRYA